MNYLKQSPKLIFGYVLFALVVIALGIVGYVAYQDSQRSINDLAVTNVTDTAFTVTWTSDSKYKGVIYYQEGSSNWAQIFSQSGKDKAYDDRDVALSEGGDYVIKEAGLISRYTHHVTVRNLKPETDYSFRVGGIINAKEGSVSITTTNPLQEDIKTPDPGYGQVEGVENTDTVVFLTLSEPSEENNKVVSTTLSEQGTFSLDMNLLGLKKYDATDFQLVVRNQNEDAVSYKFQEKGYKPFEKVVVGEAADELLKGQSFGLVKGAAAQSQGQTCTLNIAMNARQGRGTDTAAQEYPSGTSFTLLDGGQASDTGADGYTWYSIQLNSVSAPSWGNPVYMAYTGQWNCTGGSTTDGSTGSGTGTSTGSQNTSGDCGLAANLCAANESCTDAKPGNNAVWCEGPTGPVGTGRCVVIGTEKDPSVQGAYCGDQYVCYTGKANDSSKTWCSGVTGSQVTSTIAGQPANDTDEAFYYSFFNVVAGKAVAPDVVNGSCGGPVHPDYLEETINNASPPGLGGISTGGTRSYVGYSEKDSTIYALFTNAQDCNTALHNNTSDVTASNVSYCGTGWDWGNGLATESRVTGDSLGEGVNECFGRSPSGKDMYLYMCGDATISGANSSIQNGFRPFLLNPANLSTFYLRCTSEVGVLRSTSENIEPIYAVNNSEGTYCGGVCANDPNDSRRKYSYQLDGSDNFYNTLLYGASTVCTIGGQCHKCSLTSNKKLNAKNIRESGVSYDISIYNFTKISDEACTTSSSSIDSKYITTAEALSETPRGGRVLQAADGDEKLEVNESGRYAFFDDGSRIAEKDIIVSGDSLDVKLFYDDNGNGVKDETEEYFTDYSTIKLAKEASAESYTLSAGWNLINVPMVDTRSDNPVRTAGDLIDYWNDQGADIKHVARFKNGQFELFSKRESGAEYASDFDLITGEGLFVLNLATNSVVTFSGNKFEESVPLKLNSGWNLVGIISPGQSYTSETLLTKLNDAGADADTISQFENGIYQSVIREEAGDGSDLIYGNNYDIIDKRGYFIRLSNGTEVTL